MLYTRSLNSDKEQDLCVLRCERESVRQCGWRQGRRDNQLSLILINAMMIINDDDDDFNCYARVFPFFFFLFFFILGTKFQRGNSKGFTEKFPCKE